MIRFLSVTITFHDGGMANRAVGRFENEAAMAKWQAKMLEVSGGLGFPVVATSVAAMETTPKVSLSAHIAPAGLVRLMICSYEQEKASYESGQSDEASAN